MCAVLSCVRVAWPPCAADSAHKGLLLLLGGCCGHAGTPCVLLLLAVNRHDAACCCCCGSLPALACTAALGRHEPASSCSGTEGRDSVRRLLLRQLHVVCADWGCCVRTAVSSWHYTRQGVVTFSGHTQAQDKRVLLLQEPACGGAAGAGAAAPVVGGRRVVWV
jgi:hypothetical protein